MVTSASKMRGFQTRRRNRCQAEVNQLAKFLGVMFDRHRQLGAVERLVVFGH